MLRPRHLAGDEGHRLAVPQRDFNSQGYGYVTNAGLIVDGSGNVFGTAWTSVKNYPTSGPTFELVKSSSGYKYVVLLGGSFEPPTFCGPVFGTKGNIYEDGFGAGCPDCPGAIYKNDQVIDASTWGNDAVVLNASGTVYFGAANTIGALTPSGGSYAYRLLHKFSGKYDYPNQLTIDSSGTLYGATTAGGGTGCAAGCGFYFKLTP